MFEVNKDVQQTKFDAHADAAIRRGYGHPTTKYKEGA